MNTHFGALQNRQCVQKKYMFIENLSTSWCALDQNGF